MTWAILYLHGVGQSVHSDEWYGALAASLEAQGVEPPAFNSSKIIRPTYDDLLKGPPPEEAKEPSTTAKFTGDEAARRVLRAEYSRRQGQSVSDLSGLSDRRGLQGPWEGVDIGSAPFLPKDLKDAKAYLSSKPLRSAIQQRVRLAIGQHRDLVIIGHSLGSMVAVDLLEHLPGETRVRRVVTIGSPVGALGMLKRRPELLLRQFPYHRVESWVNLLSPDDIVTYGIGLAPRFPAAVDVRISLPFLKHSSVAYLAHPAVAKVVAEPLRPTQSAAVAPTREVAIPLTADEHSALDTVRFGRLVEEQITKGAKHQCYSEALRFVQRDVAQTLRSLRQEESRPASYELDLWAEGGEIDLSFSRTELDEQLLFAIVSATNSPIAPFEINTRTEQSRAIVDLWRIGFHHSKQDGEKVQAAVKAARNAFEDDSWSKVALGALGLAVLAAGPIGLVLAAPAGLAGGAAITAALAAFGPGGMVGGLALAGTLLSIGSGAVTAAVTPTTMSPDMLQTQAIRLMAYSLAQRDLDVPGDRYRAWTVLNAWHSELVSDHQRLGLFSDEGSPTLKTSREKLKLVERAVGWMIDRGLAPTIQG